MSLHSRVHRKEKKRKELFVESKTKNWKVRNKFACLFCDTWSRSIQLFASYKISTVEIESQRHGLTTPKATFSIQSVVDGVCGAAGIGSALTLMVDPHHKSLTTHHI